jgi:hypothetical protein
MASEPGFLAPLKEALRDLTAWWAAEKVEGLLIGGLATALLGRPRITRDVDGLVWLGEERWQGFLAAGASFRFAARVSDPLAFAQKARVLLLRHAPSQIDVDIAFASLPFEREALDRSVRIRVGDLRLRLPSPEDLLVMKAVAHRPVDLADVEGLIDAHPKLNRRRVRKYLREFAAHLDMPELLADVERLFARRRGRKRRR